MMRFSPIRNHVTVTTDMAIVDVELYEILRPLQEQIWVAHQLLSDIV